MVVINNKTNEVFTNVSKAEASRMIGVSSRTIHRWQIKRAEDGTNKEDYNFFSVYFQVTQVKQNKSFRALYGKTEFNFIPKS